MAKATFTFRAFAKDESDSWSLPAPIRGAVPFGIYMIAEGEGTHICSFTPSSGAEFLRNDFNLDGCDDPEGAEAYLQNDPENLTHENGGETFTYFGYVDCDDPANRPYLSEPLKITMDSEVDSWDQDAYDSALEKHLRWESPQKARALAQRAALREAAWEAAREEMNANWPSCPVTDGEAFRLHRARRLRAVTESLERYQGSTAPLLASQGVPAPLDIRV